MGIKTIFLWKIKYRYYNIYLRESYFQFPFESQFSLLSFRNLIFNTHLMIFLLHIQKGSNHSCWFLHLKCPTFNCIYANSLLTGPSSTFYTKFFFFLQTEVCVTCSEISPTHLFVFQMLILSLIFTSIIGKITTNYHENVLFPTRLRIDPFKWIIFSKPLQKVIGMSFVLQMNKLRFMEIKLLG